MLHVAYSALFALAIWAGWRDWRLLALTAVVALNVFLPMPRDTALQFYTACASAEIIVAVAALSLRLPASIPIAVVCALLVVSHALGYQYDGFPAFSPYRVICKLLEALEILCCVIFSKKVLSILNNRGAA
ncbi:MAG: hypothetical protein NTX28_07585 [Novosphingobium sp.]|nr:hypothetical protein [Novosphingobium sp.]